MLAQTLLGSCGRRSGGEEEERACQRDLLIAPSFCFFADKPNSYFTQTPPTPRDGKYAVACRSSVLVLRMRSRANRLSLSCFPRSWWWSSAS